MQIEFKAHDGNNHDVENLLTDILKNKNVDMYLEAMISDESSDSLSFKPKFCALYDYSKNDWRWIIYNNRIVPDARDNIKWLKQQPAYMNNFFSDEIIITGDGFENQLIINWKHD